MSADVVIVQAEDIIWLYDVGSHPLIPSLIRNINIDNKDINVSKQPVFTKEIEIRELNPYEQNSTLKMREDFYTVEIAKDINLKPNDLPALIEIPKEKFYDIKLASNLSMKYIKDYIIKNEEEISIPENYAIMAPKEVKNFLV